jgi:hypothetical protein
MLEGVTLVTDFKCSEETLTPNLPLMKTIAKGQAEDYEKGGL